MSRKDLDGLELDGVNRNQGAESTLAYLWTELLWATEEPSLTKRAETTASSGRA